MENDVITKEEFQDLINSFSKLNDEDKQNEIEDKIKKLIAILNEINKNNDLQIICMDNIENKQDYLSNIYMLTCCLEDEIGRLLDRYININ